jgi:hypothetical protein
LIYIKRAAQQRFEVGLDKFEVELQICPAKVDESPAISKRMHEKTFL